MGDYSRFQFRVWNAKHKDMSRGIPIKGCLYNMYKPLIMEGTVMMLCTGLTDRCDKDIYEGDILQYPDDRIFEIIWDKRTASFRQKYLGDKTTTYPIIYFLEIPGMGLPAVIGNIYENDTFMLERSGKSYALLGH